MSNYVFGTTLAKSRIFVPENYVTHRERGVIPGCVPAVDTLIERTQEQCRDHNLRSAERYCHDMRTMNFQEFINKPLERALPFFK